MFPVGRRFLRSVRRALLAGVLQSLWGATARASAILLLILRPTPFHPVQNEGEDAASPNWMDETVDSEDEKLCVRLLDLTSIYQTMCSIIIESVLVQKWGKSRVFSAESKPGYRQSDINFSLLANSLNTRGPKDVNVFSHMSQHWLPGLHSYASLASALGQETCSFMAGSQMVHLQSLFGLQRPMPPRQPEVKVHIPGTHFIRGVRREAVLPAVCYNQLGESQWVTLSSHARRQKSSNT